MKRLTAFFLAILLAGDASAFGMKGFFGTKGFFSIRSGGGTTVSNCATDVETTNRILYYKLDENTGTSAGDSGRGATRAR
jgi:hypothetical protein